ncbi:hypothetical protein T492DRAFT_854939 [Pavlovales sp. CCMP2436]|nr:hypothetical protein T492DRAFT_854939 [Pavlovales sp. CCMP2436]
MEGEASSDVSRFSEVQHVMLSSQMIEAKQARSRAEAERQLRLNRIARLQAEEMKLMKRIEETHRRTKDILTQKTLKDQAAVERQTVELTKSEELNSQRLRLVEAKMQQRHNIKEACWVNRNKTVQSVKERKEWTASESEARRKHELRLKTQLRDDIRRQDDVRRERRRVLMESQEQQLKLESEARLNGEEAKIREQEAKLSVLERREMQLLQSLKSYQGEQRMAVEQLELFLPASLPRKGNLSYRGPPALMGPR